VVVEYQLIYFETKENVFVVKEEQEKGTLPK